MKTLKFAPEIYWPLSSLTKKVDGQLLHVFFENGTKIKLLSEI